MTSSKAVAPRAREGDSCLPEKVNVKWGEGESRGPHSLCFEVLGRWGEAGGAPHLLA